MGYNARNDEIRDNIKRILRIELGAKRKRSVGIGDLTKIIFDLPTSVNEEFADPFVLIL